MLAHRYLQAFYTDWAQKVLPDILIKVSAFYIDWVYRFLENSVETMTPQNVPNQCRMLTKSILH